MSALFTFKRTKGGRTHYVAATIPKTAVIEKFTDDPAKALRFKEDDAKALLAALESDTKVYGQWVVFDDTGREVAGFCHATPEPKVPKTDPSVAASAKITRYVDIPAGMTVTAGMAADRLLADEPDDSPFRELAALLTIHDPDTQTLGELAASAAAEIKSLTVTVEELTAPPTDDDTVLTDENK